MGERLLCKQEVIGSIPFTSTNQVSEDRGQETVKLPRRQAARLFHCTL